MTKVERIKADLLPLVNSFLEDSKSRKLENYVVKNSNLPSPRANLELAYAFSELVEDIKKKDVPKLYLLFTDWGK